MSGQDDDPTLTTAALAAQLGDADLVVIDATWFMPAAQRDAGAEHAERHIPGAVFFDIDAISDDETPLPHMLPTAAAFTAHARRLGVNPDSEIVIYDAQGLFSAARVWWTFRAMGHANVRVLDGGLPVWLAERRPVETGQRTPLSGRFEARLDAGLVRDLARVRAALAGRGEQLLDARSAERFRGEAPEPRPGLRSGHMPGALNLPFDEVLADGRLLAADALEQRFRAAGVDLARPIVTTCGSGVTASVLALALARLGAWRTAVYDGSWSEWGAPGDTPVVTGP
jgi:thiosulfate/3-mercaptopyruvate sulfurtransferase